MYPWRQALAWSKSIEFHIDALGLITILGADEINASIGRLVPSRYVEFLPLVGAFVLADNRFTHKQPGFTLYNLSDGFMTTEVAGWFCRWLKAQDFHQVHHIVNWTISENPRTVPFPWLALAVAVFCHGILILLAALSGDWWGFVNAMAMVFSVAVRVVLTAKNRAGIDAAIDAAIKRIADSSPNSRFSEDKRRAKVLMLLDDSKMITTYIHPDLVRDVFVMNPTIPKPCLYRLSRWLGWAAFSVHIISIGMASLLVQICTVILVAVPTILTIFKIGCDDGNIQHRVDYTKNERDCEVSSWVSSRLKAVYSDYSQAFEEAVSEDNTKIKPTIPINKQQEEASTSNNLDQEAQKKKEERTTRRQDLYVWLEPSCNELQNMKIWKLTPSNSNKQWWKTYNRKRTKLSSRQGKTTTGFSV